MAFLCLNQAFAWDKDGHEAGERVAEALELPSVFCYLSSYFGFTLSLF